VSQEEKPELFKLISKEKTFLDSLGDSFLKFKKSSVPNIVLQCSASPDVHEIKNG